MSVNDKYNNCVECGHVAHDDPCKRWAVERLALSSMVSKFSGELSEDQRLVISVGGGIPIQQWGMLVAILAANPASVSEMADGLREIRKSPKYAD